MHLALQVFQPGTGNEEVFSHTQPLIVSALDGFNVCIFAYGQTGEWWSHPIIVRWRERRRRCGSSSLAMHYKTFTMLGMNDAAGSGKTFTMEGNESSRGINYRSLETLFALRDERAADVKYDIAVAMVEIYNEVSGGHRGDAGDHDHRVMALTRCS